TGSAARNLPASGGRMGGRQQLSQSSSSATPPDPGRASLGLSQGREEEEIRALWKAAHQKVLLDETWLSAVLKQPSPPPVSVPVEESGDAAVLSVPPPTSLAQASQPGQSPPPGGPVASRAPAASRPRVDWGDALDVPN